MTAPLPTPPGRAEASPPASLSAFGPLFEALPDAMVGIAADERIVVANSHAERLFGYRAGELVGKRLNALVPERSRTVHVARHAGFFADPQTRPMAAGWEPCGRRRDGSEFPVEISLSSVETAAGRLAIAAVRDIGAWRLAERAIDPAAERELRRQRELLIEREHQLSEAHALARLGTWEWDLSEPRARWSAETCRIFGQPMGCAPTYDEFVALIHPDDRARIDLRVTTVGPDAESDSDCRILLPDGQLRHVHIRRFGRIEEDGEVHSLFGTVQDITELKRAEQRLRERERQLEDAQALAHFGSWELDVASDQLSWSDELCRIFGQPLGYAPTVAEFIALVHPDDRRSVLGEVERSKESSFSDSEYRIVRRDGTVRHVHTRRFGRLDPDGRVAQLWGTTQDVTERTERERALRQAREHSDAIVAAMREGYCLTIDGTITAVNDALCELTGFAREELIGAGVPLPFWPPEQLEQMTELRHAVVHSEGGTFELTIMRKDGTRFDAEVTAQPAHNPDGSLLGFVNTIRDISERKRQETDLQHRATTDPLTGVANHRTFHERLATEVARAGRHGRPLSVAILDLDHFKQINDHFGHPVGDEVLEEVATRLAALCRAGELIARVGGEEFAWLLPDTTADAALMAAERGRHAISSRPIPAVGTVTLSAGVCDLAQAGGLTELYDRADQALYQAKRDGRNQSVSFAG